ncbi:MAG: hypothetical protein JXL80_00510 [Planctomycetes bacterium]|nr:hypothetical protein [Planctomycetota bacterium]
MMPEWNKAIHQLNRVDTFDYFKKRSMPGYVEPLLSQLLVWFTSATESERLVFFDALTVRVCDLLGWYGRKLAGLAVREHSSEALRKGLIALAIAMHEGDFRDLIGVLSLLHNSARHLNEEPQLLFDWASETCGAPTVQLFREFLDRPPETRSIEAFGFSEGTGPRGFDYVPLRPEDGGPTPF